MSPSDETAEVLREQLHELLAKDHAGVESALSIATRPRWRPPLAAAVAIVLVGVLAVAALLIARPTAHRPVSPYGTGVTLTATRLVPTPVPSTGPPS